MSHLNPGLVGVVVQLPHREQVRFLEGEVRGCEGVHDEGSGVAVLRVQPLTDAVVAWLVYTKHTLSDAAWERHGVRLVKECVKQSPPLACECLQRLCAAPPPVSNVAKLYHGFSTAATADSPWLATPTTFTAELPETTPLLLLPFQTQRILKASGLAEVVNNEVIGLLLRRPEAFQRAVIARAAIALQCAETLEEVVREAIDAVDAESACGAVEPVPGYLVEVLLQAVGTEPLPRLDALRPATYDWLISLPQAVAVESVRRIASYTGNVKDVNALFRGVASKVVEHILGNKGKRRPDILITAALCLTVISSVGPRCPHCVA